MKLLHFGLALTLMWALPAFSQVVIEIPVINDSYVHNLEPNVSFGSENSMMIGAKGGAEGSICQTYVQFDMAGYDGDPVESALLHMYAGESSPSGVDKTFSLYLGAGDSWGQDFLTWNNAPGFLPAALGVRTSNFDSDWVTFDVSSVASTVSEIGGKITFVAVQNNGPSGSWVSFSSSEWAPVVNQRPFLEIRFQGTVPVETKTLDDVKSLYFN